MKICAIPLDIAYADPEANILSAASALRGVEGDTDLVVLPELFTTSFVPDTRTAESVAESTEGHTMDAVRRWAAFFGTAIAGSFLCKEGGKLYNRAFFTEPGGETTYYDKRHLFPLSTEDTVYTAGARQAPTVRYRGWNFRLILCFDLRFPVWDRNTGENPYDVLLVPSNWPGARAGAFELLLGARAVENQVYTVGANRSGTDKYGEYPRRMTRIYDPQGEAVQETRRDGLVYAWLEREVIAKGRERFPAWKAADRFEILGLEK